MPRLRAEHPEFLTLGDYKPEERTGPGIWLRCVLARTISLTPEAIRLPLGPLPGGEGKGGGSLCSLVAWGGRESIL